VNSEEKASKKDSDAESSDEESEDSAALSKSGGVPLSSRSDGTKTPKESEDDTIDFQRLYNDQQEHLHTLQVLVHDLETRLNDARLQVTSREEQLNVLRNELESPQSAAGGEVRVYLFY
jgi:uncharacterized protein YlxW (UPF0749 family)